MESLPGKRKLALIEHLLRARHYVRSDKIFTTTFWQDFHFTDGETERSFVQGRILLQDPAPEQLPYLGRKLKGGGEGYRIDPQAGRQRPGLCKMALQLALYRSHSHYDLPVLPPCVLLELYIPAPEREGERKEKKSLMLLSFHDCENVTCFPFVSEGAQVSLHLSL